jgi:hypothetical protein
MNPVLWFSFVFRTIFLFVFLMKRIRVMVCFFPICRSEMSLVEKLLASSPHVHIHEDKRVHVEEVLRSLINDGRKMLHVVADFDFTLSMYEKDGVPGPSTFAVIEDNEAVVVRFRR